MHDIDGIQDGSQINPDINSRDARFKINDRIKKTQNKWKGEKLSEKSLKNSMYGMTHSG